MGVVDKKVKAAGDYEGDQAHVMRTLMAAMDLDIKILRLIFRKNAVAVCRGTGVWWISKGGFPVEGLGKIWSNSALGGLIFRSVLRLWSAWDI
jgi:hypothetical protein